MRVLPPLLIIIFTFAMAGCASNPVNPFFDARQPPINHAVLQALNGDMRKHKGNFFNPFNKGNWITAIDSIKTADSPNWTSIAGYSGVPSALVTPGSYVVKILCVGKGFRVWIDINMPSLQAGHDYQFECYGFSVRNVEVLLSSQPTAVTQLPPTPSAASNPIRESSE